MTDEERTETTDDAEESTDTDKDRETDTERKADDTTADENETTVSKDELARLRREVAKAAKDKRDRERKEAEEAGKWQDIVSAAEKEASENLQKAESAAAELERYKRNAKVATVAERLKFRDPADAHKFLPEGAAEGSEAKVETALRAVVEAKPYLVDEGSPRKGKPAGDDPDDTPAGDLVERLEKATDPTEIRELTEKIGAG